jgi:hypothetical protein
VIKHRSGPTPGQPGAGTPSKSTAVDGAIEGAKRPKGDNFKGAGQLGFMDDSGCLSRPTQFTIATITSSSFLPKHSMSSILLGCEETVITQDVPTKVVPEIVAEV